MKLHKSGNFRLSAAVLVAACVAPLGLTSAAHAVGNPSCGDTLTADTVLVADLDCTGFSGTAVLTAGADGIEIDLGGFSIIGTDDYETVIDIQNRYGVTVRNGTIDGANNSDPTLQSFGIRVVGSTYTKLENLFVVDTGNSTNSTGIGILVDTSTKTRLYNVAAVRNNDVGISVAFATDVTIKNSSFSENASDGARITDSRYIQIEYSRFDGNDNGDGLDIFETDIIRMKSSSASNNSANGIELEFSDDARFYQIQTLANGDDGFEADDATRLVLQKSNFSYNGDDGADIDDSTFQFLESSAIDNDDDGLFGEGGSGFLIKKARTHLNDDDGIDIEENYAGPAAYRIEYSASNTNADKAFDIEAPVTAKANSAAGNGTSNALP